MAADEGVRAAWRTAVRMAARNKSNSPALGAGGACGGVGAGGGWSTGGGVTGGGVSTCLGGGGLCVTVWCGTGGGGGIGMGGVTGTGGGGTGFGGTTGGGGGGLGAGGAGAVIDSLITVGLSDGGGCICSNTNTELTAPISSSRPRPIAMRNRRLLVSVLTQKSERIVPAIVNSQKYLVCYGYVTQQGPARAGPCLGLGLFR